VDDLRKLGANEVIPEEFETSIVIFSRVLHHYNLPKNVIADYIDNIRNDSYRILRTIELPTKYLAERSEFLEGLDTETHLIKDTSRVDGHSLKEINLRVETGVTIIAVKQTEKIYHNPSADFIPKAGDIILLIGKRENINRALEYLESDKFLDVI
jgi:CPA2 family monovalent cation:H+ antiporter-2